MTDLEERLTRVESELEIRRLAAEYCHGADKRDLDRFLAVWAPTAVWCMNDELKHEGLDAIARVVEAQWRTFAQYVHWTTNHTIWIDGDEARGECDVAAFIRLHSGRWVRTGGTTVTNIAESVVSGLSLIAMPARDSTLIHGRMRTRPACSSRLARAWRQLEPTSGGMPVDISVSRFMVARGSSGGSRTRSTQSVKTLIFPRDSGVEFVAFRSLNVGGPS